MTANAFFAYPAGTNLVVDAIHAAVTITKTRSDYLNIDKWEELDIPGRFIATELLQRIENSDVLVADISRLNFNVTYEVGYAIGKGKRVLLVRHRAVQEGSPTIQDVGIFDTLGYKEYSTASDLAAFLFAARDLHPIHVSDKRNEKSPLYLIQPKTKTDYDGLIVAGTKKSHLYFRSFDPVESTRLPGPDAVANVAESYGVILPWHYLKPLHLVS